MSTTQKPNEILGLLIKPASGDCNLRCEYCFYLRSANVYPETKQHRMSEEVLAKMVKQTLALNYPLASFAWQGGEPLLMGCGFFQKAIELMKQFGRRGHTISNAIQTNGISLNEEWARFFARYHFLVGVSLDGPRELHNKFRANSYDRVWQGLTVLRQHKVEFNILTVVNSLSVTKPKEVYDFFVSNDFQYLQFIPCMEETEELQKSAPYTVSASAYGEFLCQVFDEWLKNGYPNIHIRLFDNMLEYYCGLEPSTCQMKPTCGSYVVIEHNGDVYPCDFFVYPEWKLGNLLEKPLKEIVAGAGFKKFAQGKTLFRKKCRGCRWRTLCYGGCSRTRYFRRGSFSDLDYFCPAYEMFFQHSAEKFKELSREIKKTS